jgi:hypothetical protein
MRRSLTVILLAALVAACDEESGDSAVEAREQNVVRIDGLAYRVVLFRELNPRIEPDRSLVEGARPGPDEGLYAAILHVCNEGEVPARPTGDIVLEDAFGQVFHPLRPAVDPELTYHPRDLDPDECLPVPGSTADTSFDGAAVVYEVPFDAVQRRPMVLEIRPRGGGEPSRVQLDL